MKKNKISKNWVNKQRRDIYVRQSKVDGYRARSVYKLIEIDEKFKIFKGGLSVIDIGAAPVAGNSYQWFSVPAGYSSTVANPTLDSTDHANGTRTYHLIETNNASGCQATNSVVITVDALPTVTLGITNGQMCSNETFTISTPTGPANGVDYQWSATGGGTFNNNAALNPNFTPSATNINDGSVDITFKYTKRLTKIKHACYALTWHCVYMFNNYNNFFFAI